MKHTFFTPSRPPLVFYSCEWNAPARLLLELSDKGTNVNWPNMFVRCNIHGVPFGAGGFHELLSGRGAVDAGSERVKKATNDGSGGWEKVLVHLSSVIVAEPYSVSFLDLAAGRRSGALLSMQRAILTKRGTFYPVSGPTPVWVCIS